ncbi:4-amino-4-deoxychorismate lyase [Caulobacter sp. SLTY]|uniref:aminotransferase class IV n=1 Tax=Caulobacter sp. SLTY TaxID=2683262 RepID=UPI001411D81D|nr:aminotransferase class IV [Caulobacter sp. SLTY]NBB16555.1 4-amino-4-deoxychorismate lyase [Caulobacter sp. SLTY]
MSVPFDDRGLLLGDGLFETILAKDGALVLWEPHLARLTAGCAALGLPPPDADEALRLCEAAVAGLTGARGAVRLTLTAGSGGRGLDRPAEITPRLFATAAPAARPEGPAQLVTVSVRRNEGSPASRLKTLSYLDNVLARREAGPAEALMLNGQGEVACAAVANLFWIAEGRLETPALDCGVLDGIIRGQVLAAAKALGVTVAEVRAGRQRLEGAEGLFLTNSLIGVRAVDRLDGHAAPGHPLVAELAGAVSWSW